MGLLTVDVNHLGIFVASDSQPVELFAQHWGTPNLGPKVTKPIVAVRLPEFAGFAGYVGTEVVGGQNTRAWLTKAVAARASSSLAELCEELADELTRTWTTDAIGTHLSIFVAGYALGTPSFWFVSNGEVPDGASPTVPLKFEAVDDLGGRFVGVNARAGESLTDLITRTQPSFRRGVLAAASVFDAFTGLISQTIQQGQFASLDSLARYAAYVRFRFEFTKRMYDPKYGIGTDQLRPVAGQVHVYSVDPSGKRRDHAKHLGQDQVVP